VLVRTESPLDEIPPTFSRPVTKEHPPERRGFGFGGVVLAVAVGLVLSYIPIPAPQANSLEMALGELAFAYQVHVLAPIAAAVLILSVGRQGLDVLLLRAMVVEFMLGAAFLLRILSPFFFDNISNPGHPLVPWPIVIIGGGLVGAGLIGPVVALVAVLANLLWYRSLKSLRPQVGILNGTLVAIFAQFAIWAGATNKQLLAWGFAATATILASGAVITWWGQRRPEPKWLVRIGTTPRLVVFGAVMSLALAAVFVLVSHFVDVNTAAIEAAVLGLALATGIVLSARRIRRSGGRRLNQ
jgi:hypothetical protein